MTRRPYRARSLTRSLTGARSALAALACALAVTGALAGCGPRSVTPHEATPATLVPLPGSSAAGGDADGQVRKVVLTPLAEQRLRIRTVAVASAPGGGELVPITALIYDPTGVPWVYVPDGTHTYLRQAVTVQSYEGEAVVLSRGPSVGSPVVVVAAAELLGTEYGVGEE